MEQVDAEGGNGLEIHGRRQPQEMTEPPMKPWATRGKSEECRRIRLDDRFPRVLVTDAEGRNKNEIQDG